MSQTAGLRYKKATVQDEVICTCAQKTHKALCLSLPRAFIFRSSPDIAGSAAESTINLRHKPLQICALLPWFKHLHCARLMEKYRSSAPFRLNIRATKWHGALLNLARTALPALKVVAISHKDAEGCFAVRIAQIICPNLNFKAAQLHELVLLLVCKTVTDRCQQRGLLNNVKVCGFLSF